MRYTGPKNKLSRHHGKDVFGNNKSNLEKRLAQAPGQHGTSRKRPSKYGQQLKEKQFVKRVYGLTEKQFRNLYERAQKNSELPVGEALIQLLERRLDNVIYRLGIAKTRPQARQFVTNKKILINDKEVFSPSYKVKPGQKISLADNFLANVHVMSNMRAVTSIPEWLSVDKNSAKIERLPKREDVNEDLREDMVIAFYSR